MRIKKRPIIKGTVHPPAVRDCLHLLTIPMPATTESAPEAPCQAGKRKTSALSCHQTGLNVSPRKGSRHAALDMGCDTCHLMHKTGLRGRQTENRFNLAKASPALCLDCHDAKDADTLQEESASEPALRHGRLPGMSRSASVLISQADGEVHACSVLRRGAAISATPPAKGAGRSWWCSPRLTPSLCA